jgi:hypothetical protein
MDREPALKSCPFCKSIAEYVMNSPKGHPTRWAAACSNTSNVARDDGDVMCRCRTPFVRSKEHAAQIWNRRAGDEG